MTTLHSANTPSSTEWSETGVKTSSNELDDWIAIETDGSVVAFSGKVELGTGVRTALSQIVAEELDVPIERVRMVMGDTARTPNEGYTAGSKTIQNGGAALRHASAEARRVLLEMASDRLDASVEELVMRDGVISVSHHPQHMVTYAELIGGRRFNCKISGTAPLKQSEDYNLVGKPVPRVDLVGKFIGKPSFVQDMRLPGMLHAASRSSTQSRRRAFVHRRRICRERASRTIWKLCRGCFNSGKNGQSKLQILLNVNGERRQLCPQWKHCSMNCSGSRQLLKPSSHRGRARPRWCKHPSG